MALSLSIFKRAQYYAQKCQERRFSYSESHWYTHTPVLLPCVFIFSSNIDIWRRITANSAVNTRPLAAERHTCVPPSCMAVKIHAVTEESNTCTSVQRSDGFGGWSLFKKGKVPEDVWPHPPVRPLTSNDPIRCHLRKQASVAAVIVVESHYNRAASCWWCYTMINVHFFAFGLWKRRKKELYWSHSGKHVTVRCSGIQVIMLGGWRYRKQANHM